MAAADIGLGAPITIAFGQTLRFQSYTFDLQNQRATGVWQTFDGSNLTGRFFTATVTPSGTFLTFTDGTSGFDSSVTFGLAGVQTSINQAGIAAFASTHAR